jgi:hypothetical protein
MVLINAEKLSIDEAETSPLMFILAMEDNNSLLSGEKTPEASALARSFLMLERCFEISDLAISPICSKWSIKLFCFRCPF